MQAPTPSRHPVVICMWVVVSRPRVEPRPVASPGGTVLIGRRWGPDYQIACLLVREPVQYLHSRLPVGRFMPPAYSRPPAAYLRRMSRNGTVPIGQAWGAASALHIITGHRRWPFTTAASLWAVIIRCLGTSHSGTEVHGIRWVRV